MSSTYRISLLVVFLCGLLGGLPALAFPADDAGQLLAQHGKRGLIKFIQDKRGGAITIENKGRLSEYWGRPNRDYITARSVAHDLGLLKLPVQEAEDEIAGYLQDSDRETSRRNEELASRREIPVAEQQQAKKTRDQQFMASLSEADRKCVKRLRGARAKVYRVGTDGKYRHPPGKPTAPTVSHKDAARAEFNKAAKTFDTKRAYAAVSIARQGRAAGYYRDMLKSAEAKCGRLYPLYMDPRMPR